MDKTRFVKVAPPYYALAICVYFRGYGTSSYRGEIIDTYIDEPSEGDPGANHLEKSLIFEQAIRWLADRGMIEPILDDFGPPIYAVADAFNDMWTELTDDPDLPFHKYVRIREPDRWLRGALANLNSTYEKLHITDADFENPESDWQPLALDRSDPELQAVADALDDVIEQVRGDNGYAATVPEERNYVLAALSSTAKTLKESASTSVLYLNTFALEPLTKLIQRFKGAAIAIAAAAAKDALIEFLKQHGVKILDTISRWI